MGVNGLWKLLDPSGKPVPLETLENKVLAVDVSIWLHQMVKGFQDSHGNPLPNAHLLGLFHRVCKLLFYKIKPVFVFDGGVPHLKKETVATRNQHKNKAKLESDRVREHILKNLVKHTALKQVLRNAASSADLIIRQHKEKDMFELPPETKKLEEGSEEETQSSEEELHSQKNLVMADLHSVDVNSSHFKSLPADVRHDILSELKETRKQNSWGRLHEMPKESGDFSNYQMTRLLKRRSIQVSLEDAKREMGGRSLSLGELEEMLSEQGVVTASNIGMRIASDNITRYLYVKEIGKQILPKSNSEGTSVKDSPSIFTELDNKPIEKESELHGDLKAILESILHKEEEGEECEGDLSSNSEEGSTSSQKKSTQSDNVNLKLAQNFIFENSGLTQQQILAVIQYQNAMEGDVQPNSEHFLSPDQPSTSGIGSKEKALQDALTYSGVQDKLVEGKDSTLVETSYSRVGVSHTAEASCSRTGVSITVEANCSITDVGNTIEASCTRTGLSNAVSDKANEENSSAMRQGAYITESASVLNQEVGSPIDSKIDQFNSDSDSNTSFVEVNDFATVPAHSIDFEKNALEVLIQRDRICQIEDDIFADIFAAEMSAGRSAINPPLQKHTVITNLSSTDNTNTFLVGNEKICNEINGLKETNGSKMKEEDNKVAENTVNQNSCTNEVLNIERNVSTDPEEEHTKSKVTQEQMIRTPVSSEELQKLQVSLEEKHKDLLAEKGKQERLAANITDQMYMEAQELLQLFGVPYIVAPMEAEAQCAFLDIISLTDGTITDDSDIWLFGGQKVYKNFFNQKKHVMCFKASDINHYFKLERQQMILLALLVGSDYTPGIQGVGPVTALEILAAFPAAGGDSSDILRGLQRFREWWSGGMAVGPGKTSLKKKLKELQFVEGFPSLAVTDAYLHPKIDESREKFSWGLPELTSLRDFTRQKFGWTKTKTDEILLPVMKKLEERKNQMSLDSYYKVIPKLQAAEEKLSKRVQQAVRCLGRVGSSESEESISRGSRGGHISQRRKNKQTNRNTNIRSGNVEARSCGRGRGRTHESCSEHEQSHPSDVPENSTEFIPQKERDNINSLKRKLKAIEVFRTSKTGLDHTKRQKKAKRRELKEAKLSESSSD